MPPVTFLFVCTANLCRSPLAAALAGDALRGVADVVVESAGTRAVEGRPLPEATVALARELGVVVPATSTALTTEHTRRADVVLCMTRAQRREVVRLDRTANRKVFTLLEFARVLDVVSAHAASSRPADAPPAGGTLREWCTTTTLLRGLAPRAISPDEDDVVDPFPDADRLFPVALRQMRPALAALGDAVRRREAIAPLSAA